MNQCSAVEILYHPILKSIAIRPCEPDSLNAIPLVGENGEVKLSFPAKGFCTAIYDEMEWVEDFRFRFRGITKVRDGVPIMFFSLDEPRILVGKKKALVESMAEQDEESVKHFISCNRNDYPADDACDVAYPEAWGEAKHGLNYLQRQRRDRIIEGVSKKDIYIKGRKMVNPLIGIIPSREEIESELSELLMSM
jgi:hypothetical protein